MSIPRPRRQWPEPPRSALGRYGVALATVAIAVALRWLLDPWFRSNVPFVTLFAAVAFIAWWLGTRPAVFTAIVGACVCGWLFLPRSVQESGSRGLVFLFVFMVAAFFIILLGDVAARRRREADEATREVQDREQQLALVVDALPMLISYVDRELTYRFNNLTYQAWFGTPPGALRGRRVADVLGPAAFASVEPAMRRALAGESVQWESELDYLHAGRRRVSITYVPHRSDDEVRGFFVLVEDVTERRRASMAQAHLAALFASAGDAVLSADLDGRVRSWNPGAERLFGYRADEMVGQPIARLVPEDLRSEDEALLGRVRTGTTIQHLESERLARDGTRVPVSVTLSPIRDAHDHVVGTSMVARNISRRLAAVRALERSEARFRALADNAPMLIWRADEENRGTWFNRHWLEFRGRTMEEELGYGWAEGVHPDDRERAVSVCNQHSARREPFEMEFRLRRHDGAWRWVLDRGAPVFEGPQGEFTGYIGSAIDITERKQAIVQLAEAHQRKDEFLATLAHELRNPLAPILNAAQLLRLKPPEDVRLRHAVEIVERQARHMTRLVDDLLDVSRISRGSIALRRGTIRLEMAVHAAIEAARPAIEAAGHTLHLALEPDVWVDGDMTRLSQVFGNLINNATKFTPSGGHITVELRQQGGSAVVSVRDSGVGLPPDALEQVFEMFVQMPSGNSLAHDGLGIGLHLARQLIALHGGRITAHSAGANQGTEFQVRLACVPPPHAGETRASLQVRSGPAATERLRLLLADDTPDVRRSIGMMLEMEGHEVHLADDGVAAVAAAERLHPHLVLLDIGMPRMDGYEAARRIRALPGGTAMHLVALTGWGQDEDRRRALEAGFDEHWTKPIEVDALRSVIQAARRRLEGRI